MGIVNLFYDPSYSASFFRVPRVGSFIRLDVKHRKMNLKKTSHHSNETLSADTEAKYEILVILAVIERDLNRMHSECKP